MVIPNRRNIVNPICSAIVAGFAFVALLLPIVTPGLAPEFVAVQAFHGHVAIGGVVEPHSHDINAASGSELVFTSDDSGSGSSSLVLITPSVEHVAPSGELVVYSAGPDGSTDQWSPRSPTAPPKLSV